VPLLGKAPVPSGGLSEVFTGCMLARRNAGSNQVFAVKNVSFSCRRRRPPKRSISGAHDSRPASYDAALTLAVVRYLLHAMKTVISCELLRSWRTILERSLGREFFPRGSAGCVLSFYSQNKVFQVLRPAVSLLTLTSVSATNLGERLTMIERSKEKEGFNPGLFLDSPNVTTLVANFEKAQTIYSQGESCSSVLYIKTGRVKLSATSEDGKEAAIAILEPGDFLGEACLNDASPARDARAMAMEPATVLVIQKKEMLRVLRDEKDFRSYFISYLLKRKVKTESDLVDQLFNSSEKRLARALLLLARPEKVGSATRNVLSIPQETLAELIGTTRSRVNLFMNKFRRQGFIDYSRGKLQVHSSIIGGVL